jgi:translation initiation factor IF-2
MNSAINGTLNNERKGEVIARRRDALRVIAEQINLDLASLLAMNDAGYVSVATKGEKRVNVGLALSIVRHLRQVALQAIEDNQHLITADIGHGDYSARGQQLLAAKLESLQLTLFHPTNLTVLVAADEAGTLDALRDTLQQAQSNAGSETITAVDQARLTLLLAALPHLLDDLDRLIGQPSQAL